MRILLVVHGFPPAANGGTEVYVRDLAQSLAASGEDEVMVLTREANPRKPELSVRTFDDGLVRITAVNNTFQSCVSFEESYANPAIEHIAGDVLDTWDPDVVHIQHLTCLSTGIPRQAVSRRIPMAMTLNDYWLICHRGQLVNRDGRRCDGPFDGGCDGCLPPGILANETAFRAGRLLRTLPLPGAQHAVALAANIAGAATPRARLRAATFGRLQHMREAVRGVDRFLAPSRTLAETFGPFGVTADRLVRCNQGIASARGEPGRGSRLPLRVVFAGGFLPTKGLHVLLDAIERMPPGSVTVDVLGACVPYHGEDAHVSSLESRISHPAIRMVGPVPHDRMRSILDAVDVLVVPSTWIENAPFIIREAFAARVPVIASNLGGMAEMVRDGIDGLVFEPGDARMLASVLKRCVEEPLLLERLARGIVAPMSMEEDAASLRVMYGDMAPSGHHPRAAAHVTAPAQPTHVTPACPDIAAVILNYRTPEQTWLAARSLQTSRNPPRHIIIVDNGSGDGSAQRLRGTLSGVRVVESPGNGGFSAGCNIGIREALASGAEYIFLVNSDAVLAPDAILYLAAAMTRHPELGIAGPILLSREEPDHVASAGISFSRRTARMRHRGAGRRLAALQAAAVTLVDAVSGCVMLIRREVIERVGLLDEAYFFSFEDIEFCLRARESGFRTACVQEALAYHEGGRTIGRRSARRVYFATRNHLRLAARQGDSRGRALRSALVLGLNAAYVLVSPEVSLLSGATALLRGAWHHARGRYGSD
jgi:GT2 family glycosyltransferase/glycosyltransferase involved in cell wall biosynthesis